MANRIVATKGIIYENNIVKELDIDQSIGTDVRIKATGTGSCKVVGKLTSDGEYKELSLVRLSDFAVVSAIVDEEIYATDVTGLCSISLTNVSGFTNVIAKVIS